MLQSASIGFHHSIQHNVDFHNNMHLFCRFKIKARPVNTKILHRPVKVMRPETKPATVVEPFNITAPKKV